MHSAHPNNKEAPQVHPRCFTHPHNSVYSWKPFLEYPQALNCSCGLLQRHLLTLKTNTDKTVGTAILCLPPRQLYRCSHKKEDIIFSSFHSLRKQLYKRRKCNFTVYKVHDIRLCKFKIQLLQLVIWETEELRFLSRCFLFYTGEHTSRGVESHDGIS